MVERPMTAFAASPSFSPSHERPFCLFHTPQCRQASGKALALGELQQLLLLSHTVNPLCRSHTTATTATTAVNRPS